MSSDFSIDRDIKYTTRGSRDEVVSKQHHGITFQVMTQFLRIARWFMHKTETIDGIDHQFTPSSSADGEGTYTWLQVHILG